ncbi:MAG: Dabb family protein [Neisseriales bacterium]|jgi:hypothetical protein|nr:MAG: Dabb family protein [Neisseriales bacterium]
MIKHIVLLAFSPTVEESKIKKSIEKLGALRNKEVPEILSFSYGKNCSPESLDQGFNYAFVMEFANEKTRDIYLKSVAHKAIAQNEILPLLVNGIQSAIVLDYKC